MEITLGLDDVTLRGELTVPDDAHGVVAFAHGSGSGRHSPRNQMVAAALVQAGFGTLLLDLLDEEEERADARTGHLRFGVELLAGRMVGAIGWLAGTPVTSALPVGLFGASTGAAAALIAAAELAERATVAAVVSRGGRPDLAGEALGAVLAPSLLIVGERDEQVRALNEGAAARMKAPTELAIIPGASHLFEEPGALERVAELAAGWFAQWMGPRNGLHG
ncbi:dienelactone hydrolase family protein [soil metagenome]